MYKKGHKSKGKPAKSTGKKSTVEYDGFKERLEKVGRISEFVRFSGIARSTMHGWKNKDEGVPLLALLALELFEIKKKVNNIY